ncbi:MAG TPA: FAD binding domain-containing protein [Nitrososphaerales archaeon]|nr:FAD binding domain-containing protein [Nitrososphaerales archaeon]
MGRFRPVEWASPKTIEEATKILKEKRARLVAGGTGLYELAKRGMLPDTDVLVDLQGLNLEYVKVEAGTLKIGAGSRFVWLLQQEPMKRKDLAGLTEAVSNVKPVQVRNVATAGGALSLSIPFLDFPPAVLGMEGRVVLSGSEGKQRILPVSNFWLDYLLPDLRKGELLTEVQIPLDDHNTTSTFTKLGRTEGDFALVNVCAKATFAKDGRYEKVVIALGGVANTPVRQPKVESALLGQRAGKQAVSKAVGALDDLNPSPSVHGSPWYKREIAKVLVRDALFSCAEKAGFPPA